MWYFNTNFIFVKCHSLNIVKIFEIPEVLSLNERECPQKQSVNINLFRQFCPDFFSFLFHPL